MTSGQILMLLFMQTCLLRPRLHLRQFACWLMSSGCLHPLAVFYIFIQMTSLVQIEKRASPRGYTCALSYLR